MQGHMHEPDINASKVTVAHEDPDVVRKPVLLSALPLMSISLCVYVGRREQATWYCYASSRFLLLQYTGEKEINSLSVRLLHEETDRSFGEGFWSGSTVHGSSIR